MVNHIMVNYVHQRDDGSVVKMVGIAYHNSTRCHIDTIQIYNVITQTSFDNIKVGYISETDGYVKNHHC